MKHKPPKISITHLILTVTLIAGIIIYASSRLIKDKYSTTQGPWMENPTRQPTTPHKQIPHTIQPPFDIPEPADQTVKHPAHTFKNADIYTVMKKIQEWYPVIYAFRIPVNNRFTGTIPKDLSLNEVLNGLVKMTSDTIVFERIGEHQIVINPIGK